MISFIAQPKSVTNVMARTLTLQAKKKRAEGKPAARPPQAVLCVDRVGDGDDCEGTWLGSACLVIIFISFDGFGSSLAAAATPLCSCICMPFHGQVQRTRLNCRKHGGERERQGQRQRGDWGSSETVAKM